MTRFVLGRLVLLVPTLLGVLAVTFLLLYVFPRLQHPQKCPFDKG